MGAVRGVSLAPALIALLRAARCVALVALALSVGARAADAQQPHAGRPSIDPSKHDVGVDRALVARWRALPPERRAELLQRFAELRALPQVEREALVQRARELERLERDVLEDLSTAQRERLDAMPPEARHRVLRELTLDRARQRAARLREVVPPERLEALQRGDRATRERMRGELRRQHERELPQRLRHVAEELQLPPQEIERLTSLPTDLQRVELQLLTRRRMERWIEQNGLPAGLDAEAWQRMRAAPPEAFARRYGRLREGFEGHAWLQRIRAAAEPTIEERIELAGLPHEQRARVLGERVRARVLAILRELGVDETELRRLESLPVGRLRLGARDAVRAHLGLPPEPAPPPRERRGR